MDPKERLRRQALGQDVDRVPTIGGWIGGAHNLAALASVTVEQYVADPLPAVVAACKGLGIDGMVKPAYPRQADEIRTGSVQEQDYAGIEPEAVPEFANSLPDSEREVLRGFDAAAVEAEYRNYFAAAARDWRGLVPIPNFWDLGGHFPLYYQFGYVAFLSACALYPEAVGKIWRNRSLVSREKAKVLARLYRQLDLVPLLFCGEDLCNNEGPMVSPDFLRKWYFPTVRMIAAPLVESGIRLVHHCDGDVRPVVDDFVACGFSGLQGFQYELGVDPREFLHKPVPVGDRMLLFGGMSVARTLPFGTPEDVRAEIDWLHDITDGGRGLFVFTANVTGPETPVENLRAGYERARSLPFGRIGTADRDWPGRHIRPGTAPLG